MKVHWSLTPLILMLFVFSSAAGAQEKVSGIIAPEKNEAVKKAREWASLVSTADVAGLEKLLDNEYVHIHATALVESKQQFIDALRNGYRKYDQINLEEITVRDFGNTFVVTGKYNLRVTARGKLIEGINRFSLVIVKTGDESRVVSFQATPVPLQK